MSPVSDLAGPGTVATRHVAFRRTTSRHMTCRRTTSRHAPTRHLAPHTWHLATKHLATQDVSPHMTSRHMASRHMASHHATSRHVALRHIGLFPMAPFQRANKTTQRLPDVRLAIGNCAPWHPAHTAPQRSRQTPTPFQSTETADLVTETAQGKVKKRKPNGNNNK